MTGGMIVSAWARWIVGRDRGTPATHQARRHALPFVAFAAVGIAVVFAAPDVGVDRTRWQFVAAVAGSAIAVPFMVVWLGELRPVVAVVPPLCGLALLVLLAAATGGATSSAMVLILLPLAWFGYAGSDRQIALGLTVFGLLLAALMAWSTPPGHRLYDWDHGAETALAGLAVVTGLRRLARDRDAFERRLRAAAITDPLTGLPNRAAWSELGRVALAQAARRGDHVLVASLDLDGFKELNDSRGHQAGDDALREVAVRWREAVRAGDILCRVGGDEFLLLLVASGFDDIPAVVERVRAHTPAPLSCSAGIARWDGRQSLVELVRAADGALYAAKATGRDRTVVSSAATDTAVEQRRRANVAVARAGEMAVGAGDGGHHSFDDLVSDAGVVRLTARENHFVSVSPNCVRVLGWQPEQLLALTFTELVHPDDLAATMREAGRVGDAGAQVEGFETRFRCADGTYRRLRFHACTDGSLWRAVAVEVPSLLGLEPRIDGLSVAAAPRPHP